MSKLASGKGIVSALACTSGKSAPAARACSSCRAELSRPMQRAPRRASAIDHWAAPQPSSSTSLPTTSPRIRSSASGSCQTPTPRRRRCARRSGPGSRLRRGPRTRGCARRARRDARSRPGLRAFPAVYLPCRSFPGCSPPAVTGSQSEPSSVGTRPAASDVITRPLISYGALRVPSREREGPGQINRPSTLSPASRRKEPLAGPLQMGAPGIEPGTSRV